MTLEVRDAGPVGLVGLGHIGLAFAELLVGAGRETLGYRRRPDGAIEALGGRACTRVEILARACETIVLALPDEAAALQVLEAILAHAPGPRALINVTTVSPAGAGRLATMAAAAGHAYLDAPISGAGPQVRVHAGILLIGGDEALLEIQRPLLEILAARVVHLGPVGAASAVKQAALMMMAANTVVAAEGLAFAEHFGVPPRLALEVLGAGPSASAALAMRGPWMVEGNYGPHLGGLEGLSSLLAPAMEVPGASVAMLEQVLGYVAEARATGLGHLDLAAVYELVRPSKPR